MKEKVFRSARPLTWFGTGKSRPETAVKLCITSDKRTVTWAESRGQSRGRLPLSVEGLCGRLMEIRGFSACCLSSVGPL